MSAPARQMTIREVLQLRPVRRLWLAQIVSVFGDFLAIFAVLSYVSFNLHATAAQVTGISVAFMIPFALIGPVAGVFVDRWNVKRTMIGSDLIRAVLALGLVFTTSLGQVYVILFLLSAVSAFFVPAQTVTLRTIVPREGLLAANSLVQQAFQVMRIFSPALAGAMVGWAIALVLNMHLVRGPAYLSVFVGVPAVLMLVAAVACWVPARRAATVDPMIALRQE